MHIADGRCKMTVINDGIADLASQNTMWSAATHLVAKCVSRGKWGIRRDLGKSKILCSVWNETIASANDDRPGPSPYRFNVSLRLKRVLEAVLLPMLQHCTVICRRWQICFLHVAQRPDSSETCPPSMSSTNQNTRRTYLFDLGPPLS